MKKWCGRLFFGIFGVILTAPLAAAGQQGTVPSRHIPPMTRDMRYREWMLKTLEKDNRKKPDAREQQLAYAQLSDDFRFIQTANNRLLRAVIDWNNVDFKVVATAAGEIQKKASRLKKNLALPAPPKVEARTTEPQEEPQLKTVLAMLDGLIVRFVNNPLFKESEVLDTAHSARAQRDLERIIEISGRVKKEAERRVASRAPMP